jgi:hypothetical protein
MDQSFQQRPRSAVRGNRLLCTALLLGQAMYAVMIAALHSIDAVAFEPPISEVDLVELFAMVGLAAGVVALPTAFVLRKITWQRGAGGDDAKLLRAFTFGNVAFQVVLEGAGLLNLTLWLATGTIVPYVPVFAVLFLIGVMALFRSHTPTG